MYFNLQNQIVKTCSQTQYGLFFLILDVTDNTFLSQIITSSTDEYPVCNQNKHLLHVRVQLAELLALINNRDVDDKDVDINDKPQEDEEENVDVELRNDNGGSGSGGASSVASPGASPSASVIRVSVSKEPKKANRCKTS